MIAKRHIFSTPKNVPPKNTAIGEERDGMLMANSLYRQMENRYTYESLQSTVTTVLLPQFDSLRIFAQTCTAMRIVQWAFRGNNFPIEHATEQIFCPDVFG